MEKIKKIVCISFVILAITGCSCSRKNNSSKEESENISDITLEIPMSDVYKLEIKTGQNEKAYIKVGDSFKIITWITPKNLQNEKIEWVVSNPNIVTITNDGTVTGIKSGTTNIKAYSKENDKIISNIITIEVLQQ